MNSLREVEEDKYIKLKPKREVISKQQRKRITTGASQAEENKKNYKDKIDEFYRMKGNSRGLK